MPRGPQRTRELEVGREHLPNAEDPFGDVLYFCKMLTNGKAGKALKQAIFFNNWGS
jgi:hypothetical protein